MHKAVRMLPELQRTHLHSLELMKGLNYAEPVDKQL